MFCDEALDAVEAIAAGDLAPEGRIASHLETCPQCAAALRSARALDAMLRKRALAAAPPGFTTRTLARVRRARWRSDQYVDVAFNASIAIVMLAMLVGGWILLVRTGLVSFGGDAFAMIESISATAVQRVGPGLRIYTGAAALLATALLIWWWAERDSDMANG